MKRQCETSQIENAAAQRNAIKVFDKSKIISKTDFDCLLRVAQFCPSSMGLEPWRIIVVQNEYMRKDLCVYSSGAQRQLDSCSHFVVFSVQNDLGADSDYVRNICLRVKHMDNVEYKAFVEKLKMLQIERLCLTDKRSMVDWACKQAYIAMGSMITSASLLGIDSCPIEGFSPSDVTQVLIRNGAMCENESVAVMAAFGYRTDLSKLEKVRRPMEEIVKYI